MFPIPSPIPTWTDKVKIMFTGWIKAIFKANADPPPCLLMKELQIGIEVMVVFIFIPPIIPVDPITGKGPPPICVLGKCFDIKNLVVAKLFLRF